MKVAIRGGHNYKVKGAVDILDEVVEDRKILAGTIKYLNQLGDITIDVSPNETNSKSEDLAYGVSRANEAHAGLFTSIHLNSDDDEEVKTGYGCEVLLNPANTQAVTIANRILANLSTLGFHNRGIKDGVAKGLYETRHTNMTAILVECFFLNNANDVALYRKVGADAVGRAIAEGLTGRKVPQPQPEVKPMLKRVVHDTVAMGIDKNGLIYPVKEFRNGDNITISRIVNQLGELDINGVKAYITVGYAVDR